MKRYSISFIVFFICSIAFSNICIAQSDSLIGMWDKVLGPGDPIRYTFLIDCKAIIQFQTSIDSARYLTFPIYSSSLRHIGFGQDGIGSWQGIYDVSSDTLKIEGFWYTGQPPAPTPTFFNAPTTYVKVSTSIINNENKIPESFLLHQNYPNPFNPETTIEFVVQQSSRVKLKIYNTTGQIVRTLVDDYKTTGKYSLIWDGKDNSGKTVPSGNYFYQISVGALTFTKKMIHIK